MDMDLDDLDGPSQAPSRPTRFAPKNSKLKPKPKAGQPPPPQSQELDSTSVTLPAKEEVIDVKEASLGSDKVAKVENVPVSVSTSAATSNGNEVVKMDNEINPDGDEPKEEPMEEDNNEEEDHVVREIDVFFTPSMDSNTQLYVLQYPLKPCWRPYELDERCEEVRVKTATSEVEIDLSVDVDSKNYDPDADNGVRMTKQILSSSWKPPRRTGYAVGVLIGNKLHLNPVHAVVQLRPSMQHFRFGGPKKKIMNNNVQDAVKEEKSVGHSRKQIKQPGDSNDPLKDSEETWIPLTYHGATSEASGKCLHKMVSEEGSRIQFSMSSSDYVNSLCPGTSNLGSRGPSKRYLLSLSLEDRFKIWLLEGRPVHRFDGLKHLAPDDTVEDVLGVLCKLAYLVQGLWIPKSSLLDLPGLDALARDYTLYLFSKSHHISYKEIPQKEGIKRAMKNVLNVFAVERPGLKDWKFKEEEDIKFLKLHPDIIQEQEKAWEKRGEIVYAKIYGDRSGPGMKNPPKANMTDKETANKGVPKTSSKAPIKTSISNETREALLKALLKLFQTYKVCSFQRICQLLRDMATSEANRPKGAREIISAASGLEAPPEELRAIINQVAIDIHGVFVSKSSTDHSYDDLRKIVINLLRVEKPNATLKKASIIEAGKMKLKREVPNTEYNKVMNELCVSRGSGWVLKSGDGSPN